jgi:hypothetical protein
MTRSETGQAARLPGLLGTLWKGRWGERARVSSGGRGGFGQTGLHAPAQHGDHAADDHDQPADQVQVQADARGFRDRRVLDV